MPSITHAQNIAFKTMLDACELKIATLGDNSGVYGAMDIAVNRLEGSW